MFRPPRRLPLPLTSHLLFYTRTGRGRETGHRRVGLTGATDVLPSPQGRPQEQPGGGGISPEIFRFYDGVF